MSESETFRYELTLADDGRVTLALAGEIDSSNVAQLGEAFAHATALELTVLVVDAARLDFCDAAGLRCFATASQLCAERGIAFWVDHPPPIVRRLFEVTGLDELFANPDGFPSR